MQPAVMLLPHKNDSNAIAVSWVLLSTQENPRLNPLSVRKPARRAPANRASETVDLQKTCKPENHVILDELVGIEMMFEPDKLVGI